jgi:hypothetical protein
MAAVKPLFWDVTLEERQEMRAASMLRARLGYGQCYSFDHSLTGRFKQIIVS